MPDYEKYLNTFVEIRVVHSIFSVKSKLEDWVMTFLFLSYVENHIGGT